MLKTSLIAARSQKHAKITVIRAACRGSVSSMYTAEVIQSFEPTRIGVPRDSRASSRFFFTETRHLAAKHVPTYEKKIRLDCCTRATHNQEAPRFCSDCSWPVLFVLLASLFFAALGL